MAVKKGLINIVFVTGIFFYLCVSGVISMAHDNEEKVYMKVAFYTFDKKTQTKGKFLGCSEFKEGKLTFDVTDPELEKILKYDFTTEGEGAEEITLSNGRKVLRGGLVVYESGTPEHLRVMAEEVENFGYIGEIVDE